MLRNKRTQAVVLHTHGVGEIHKGILLITRNMGIVSAIAHGAKKLRSRLRSSTEVFCCSTVYLYHDPVKKTYKINDMVVNEYFEGLRSSLKKFFTASLWTEIIIKSFGGGESCADVYELFRSSLAWLNRLEEDSCLRVSFQFLWRFLKLVGSRPDPEICAACGRPPAQQEICYLSPHSPGFLCPDCTNAKTYPLTPGARRYLAGTVGKPLSLVVKYDLDSDSAGKLKSVLYELVQGVLETRLKSIECAGGML